jgi:hypothetical protein
MYSCKHLHKIRWKKSMDKYIIIKLETHVDRWVVRSFRSLVHPTIASFFIKFKTFSLPKLPKDETWVRKMCFYTMGLTKNYKSTVHKDLDLEYLMVIWFIKDTIKRKFNLQNIFFHYIYIYISNYDFLKKICVMMDRKCISTSWR